MAEDYKLQVSISLPPVVQYHKGDMLNIRANTQEELETTLDVLFGEGSSERILGRFLAETLVELDFSKPQKAAPATPTSNAGTASTTSGEGETCPQCGNGTLVKKNRKDGKGTFVGCNDYPNCAYIKR